ncbi:MAG: C-terminal helicase domain-containing protein [Chryseolinea sp.]
MKYCYLDGSISATQRKEQVEQFQNDETIKIFSVSLNASGVGLNLTAADYVYLIDPWWNPAAEQQAIDRTNRIGQTKKVFAYMMICVDSVEERSFNFRKKRSCYPASLSAKRQVFVKKLARDDIEYLFS